MSLFPAFLHDYIYDIVNVECDGTCGFHAIATLLGWGEEPWFMVRTQLDNEVYQHCQLYFNVLYDTISVVRSLLLKQILGYDSYE